MKLNSKVTGGLAWAGLIVIIAVPSADMLTRPQGAAATITSDMDGIQTSGVGSSPATLKVRTVVPPAAGNDPVDTYVAKGKKLPSYISDAPAETAAVKPAPTVKLIVPPAQGGPTSAPATTEVATTAPMVAPVPYPASKRPKPAVAPVETAALGALPLIIDEAEVQRRDEAVARVLDDNDLRANSRVTGDQLEEWDSGSLAEYLERRGLLNEERGNQASNSDFDDDGFFLDEGPNNDDGRRVIRRVRPGEFFFF